ncbi:MAG: molybdopterin-dependent oxidoreductase [Deltaproteobacteria bacterium]|nr:molybdopterin-dependent oxidoreductase [Deltaproteobacteria bacterium]
MSEYSVIGKRTPKIESVQQVTGHAEFVGDMVLPRMLFGKTLKSPHPHAKILNIDITIAQRMPGVKAVVTGKDGQGIKYGPFRSTRDRDLLAVDKVRFIGDEVAAVAAVDEDTAEEALDLIRVEYEPLPAIFDPEEAILEGAPRIHDFAKKNIAMDRFWDFGDVDKGFDEADHVRRDRFSSQMTTHGFLEPHACITKCDPTGKITIWANVQRPFLIRRDLALVLGVPLNSIRVIKPFVGSGFGGKNLLIGLYYSSVLLAMKTGRPVKMVYDLKESIVCTHRRVPVILDIKTGVKRNGTLVAQHSKAVVDGGAFNVMGPATLYNIGLAHVIPYRLPNFKLEAFQAFTNKIPNTPMRGHGQLQVHFAVECQLDMIAEDLGLDPADIRLKNALQTGDVTVNGLEIISSGLSEAIQNATGKAGWKKRRGNLDKYRGRGIGCSSFPTGARETSQSDSGAIIQLTEDGKVILLVGVADIGQGCNTVMAQITAEVLGITMDDITTIAADTDITPFDPGAFASRTTFYAGNAVKITAEDVRNQLAEVAAKMLEADPDDLEFKDKHIFVKGSPGQGVSFEKVTKAAQTSGRGRIIIGRGSYFPSNVVWPDRKTQVGNITGSYSFSTSIAEVDIDKNTGKINLLKVTMAHDGGQPINDLLLEGQMEGATSMAMGHALYEHLIIKDGKILNPSLRDYKMPTAMDNPEMDIIKVIIHDPEGPFGAKEVGEGFICCSLPAIVNAIHDATGVWIKDLPITSEKILEALKEKITKS